MTERPSLGVGLMSGTSLDGMDAALVRFHGPDRAELVAFHTRPYTAAERRRLLAALDGAPPRETARVHADLAHWAAEAVERVLATARVPASDLAFIAFPGQTYWHEPPHVSLALGEPAILAERFGVRVVSAFRARDVAAGGQGAPLVPIADVLLFAAADRPRVLLNVGGIANFTFVRFRDDDEGAFACDTGPGMLVIDAIARLVDPELPYDADGQLAERGRVHDDVLQELLADPFFAAPPPKSTGRERFGEAYARALHARVPGPDGVATAVALTAETIARAIVAHTPADAELVVSGGGYRHPVLMQQLSRALWRLRGRPIPVLGFDALFFDGDAKEAVAFALLGYLAAHGQPANLPVATGARGRRRLGAITEP
ncbi:MAG: anhydro-N-acetylmuramic acid kinase [Gemmatimonadales bacterium]|nr:anhydro-N-acetylmuramic acid kinase [Gemmatimonadales bacterium]